MFSINLKQIISIILIIFSYPIYAQSSSIDEAQIIKNISPVGKVHILGKQPVEILISKSGLEVYNQSCLGCHTTGALNAPMINKKSDWDDRLKKGQDTLIKNAINGFKSMPAKGGCSSCSDEEIKKAVLYILENSL